MRWPIAIAASLGVVVAVNLLLAWIATSNPDPVSPSYEAEAR